MGLANFIQIMYVKSVQNSCVTKSTLNMYTNRGYALIIRIDIVVISTKKEQKPYEKVYGYS